MGVVERGGGRGGGGKREREVHVELDIHDARLTSGCFNIPAAGEGNSFCPHVSRPEGSACDCLDGYWVSGFIPMPVYM